MNFADPNRFNNVQEFLENFGDLKEAAQVAKLHNILKPYLLRRIKEDVEKSLPPKEETIVEVNRRESLFAAAEYISYSNVLSI